MRIVGDLSSFSVLQAEKTPDEGEPNPFNGRFGIPVPDGASVDMDDTSYILPQDSGSLPYQMAQNLLARFPMYSHIVWNFLLEDTDVAALDLTATGPGGIITRAQTGRGAGPGPLGQAPNTTVVLPQNNALAPPRPGCLVTDTIDIGPVTSGAGSDEFLVWWYLWGFEDTQDIASDFGLTRGLNEPTLKNIIEVDQEPLNLSVWISHDDGATWTGPVGRLEPTDLITFNTRVRIAFVNAGTLRYYLAAYAVMF